MICIGRLELCVSWGNPRRLKLESCPGGASHVHCIHMGLALGCEADAGLCKSHLHGLLFQNGFTSHLVNAAVIKSKSQSSYQIRAAN